MSQPQEFLIPEAVPELLDGPQWLRQSRQSARESFNAAPLPPRGLHLWRYTDPAHFVYAGEMKRPVDSLAPGEARTSGWQLAQTAAFVHDLGGRIVECRQQPDGNRPRLHAMSLMVAAESHRALVEQHLYQLVNQQTGKFEAMNGALWRDGIFIYVPDNTKVAAPVHLLREAGGAGSSQMFRLLVVAGRNSELTLIDEYIGGSRDASQATSYANSAVEIFGGPDSRVRYVALQHQEAAMNTFVTTRAKIESNASMLTVPLVFGASVTKQNFGVILSGSGAQSEMYGLLFGTGRCHFDNHTLHHHAGSHTRSNINFKVILKDKSVSAYTGLIRIDHDAKVCEAYQENRNLLLNAGTKAESVPELEILNEDVSCTHGATVGPIDPMSLFYLASRGIPRPEAVRMIVSGFVNPTLELVPEDMREQITDVVSRRLETI